MCSITDSEPPQFFCALLKNFSCIKIIVGSVRKESAMKINWFIEEQHEIKIKSLPMKFTSKTEAYIPPGTKITSKRATFQAAMRVTVVIGQFFGLNPVQGVCEIDASRLRFSFFSWRAFYSMLSICGQSFVFGLCLLNLFKESNAISSNTSLVFNGLNGWTTLMFFRIAMLWPKLCQFIAKTEAADPCLDEALAKRCNTLCLLILFLALLEHLLSVVAALAMVLDCQSDRNVYEAFVTNSYPWISNVPYNTFYGVLTQLLNIQCTFNWNFANIFVICVSFYLTARFNQINGRINAIRGTYVPTSFWRTVREDYSRLTYLVKRIDDVISGVIFVSFANNLFFICLQLLHTLEGGIKASPLCHVGTDNRPLGGYEQAVYFVYSFAFLVLRSLAVSLILSSVHSASREPVFALYDVDSTSYCIEVQRFIEQIHGDNIALTGLQFFSVKRGIVLSIAATIVTYELVLIQFTTDTPAQPTANVSKSI